MIKVVLKEKGYPITKEIGKVKEMLFTERDGKDWLYIMLEDDDNSLRSMGVDLTKYNVVEVKEDLDYRFKEVI